MEVQLPSLLVIMSGSLSDPLSRPPSFCSSSGHTPALCFVCEGTPAAGGPCLAGDPEESKGEGLGAQGSSQGRDLEGSEKDEEGRRSSDLCHWASRSWQKGWASFCFVPGQGFGPCTLSVKQIQKSQERRVRRGRSSSQRWLSEHHWDV